MFKKISLGLLFFCFFFTEIQAQSSSEKAINELKSGVLIVRLKSDFNKLKEMNRLIESGNISEEAQANLEKNIKKIESENAADHKLRMQAFADYYSFSEVLFAYDTLRRPGLKNGGKDCFLNSELEIVRNLSLDNRPFLMLYEGNADATSGSGAEGWIFRDSDFKALKKPFPYFVKSTSFMFVFNRIFKPSIAEPRNIERMVKKLNRKLEKFHEKIN